MRAPETVSPVLLQTASRLAWSAGRCLWIGTLLLSGVIPAARSEIKGYTKPAVISEAGIINRAPVISETGLVAWYGHSKSALLEGEGESKIYAYSQGQTQPISSSKRLPNTANTRPIVSANTVVWHTERSPSQGLENGKVDFVLREVPDAIRDLQFPELPGFFAAKSEVDGGASFNLDPKQQRYQGPYSNIYQWAAAYFGEGGTSNDVKKIVEQFLSTNKTEAVTDPRLYSESYFDVSPKTRRKTVEFGEIVKCTPGAELQWITQDFRMDINPSCSEKLTAWQRAKAFPFGWEIMAYDGAMHYQLTTNFYYDVGPKVYEDTVVWYGWDGNDYEIYKWDLASKLVSQITTNDWDDVTPVIGKGIIAWESYPTVEADIWAYRDGRTIRLSPSLEDDINPTVWNGNVVWQSFDGDDFELWMYDPERGEVSTITGLKGESVQLTNNDYDDVSPVLNDGLLVWMGYTENWDAEIFAMDIASRDVKQITDNDYEDKDPQTAKGVIVWQADTGKSNDILLASPDQ